MPVAPATTDDLVDLIRKSQLVPLPKLDKYLRESGVISTDARTLAVKLVRDGVLTNFQAEQLLRGKYKGFELGKYRLLDRIGSGGMGQVFLAEHSVMRRTVALKVLPPNKANDPVARERFLREARAIGSLAHDNIVRAYDVDECRGMYFLVMEFVEGLSLQELVVRNGPLAPERAANYLWQSALGLQAAHVNNLVHRDIKPSNLLIDRGGVVKLLDLGLARFFDETTSELTALGESPAVLGTADYLSPEQAIDSHEVDIRADIYSLGATGYFLLTGRPPFPSGTTTQKLLAHQMKEPESLLRLRPDVPVALIGVIGKMMRKLPADRYPSPAELLDALEPWSGQSYPPTSAELQPGSRASAQNLGAMPSTGLQGLKSSASVLPMIPSAPEPPPKKKSRGYGVVIAAGVFALAGVVAFGATLLSGGTNPPPAEPKLAPAAGAARTWSVDQSGKANSTPSLAEALVLARPGDTIFVRVPRIAAAVRIDKPDITLIGDGPSGPVGWTGPPRGEAESPLLEIADAARVQVRNFVFDGGKRPELIRVSGVCPGAALETIDVTNFAQAGVRLDGARGEPAAPIRLDHVHSPGGSADAAAIRLTGDCRSVLVRGGRFVGPGRAGVAIAGPAADIQITLGRFFKLAAGVHLNFDEVTNPVSVAVSNNTFANTTAVHVENPPATNLNLSVVKNLFAQHTRPVRVNDGPILVPDTAAKLVWTDESPNPLGRAPSGIRYFRKLVKLDRKPTAAMIEFAADNAADVWVNGQSVGRADHGFHMKHMKGFAVEKLLQAGTNVLAIAGDNSGSDNSSHGNGAVLVARLTADGREVAVTDETWKLSLTEVPDWARPNFDDSGWGRARVIAKYADFDRSKMFTWDSELSKHGDLFNRVLVTKRGNVVSQNGFFSPFIPSMKTAFFLLPAAPADEAKFLRYSAEDHLAKVMGSPGVPPDEVEK